jgi:hypothetical protein
MSTTAAPFLTALKPFLGSVSNNFTNMVCRLSAVVKVVLIIFSVECKSSFEHFQTEPISSRRYTTMSMFSTPITRPITKSYLPPSSSKLAITLIGFNAMSLLILCKMASAKVSLHSIF